jgi:hypothetical protein
MFESLCANRILACYFALPWFATAAIFAAIASASPR